MYKKSAEWKKIGIQDVKQAMATEIPVRCKMMPECICVIAEYHLKMCKYNLSLKRNGKAFYHSLTLRSTESGTLYTVLLEDVELQKDE